MVFTRIWIPATAVRVLAPDGNRLEDYNTQDVMPFEMASIGTLNLSSLQGYMKGSTVSFLSQGGTIENPVYNAFYFPIQTFAFFNSHTPEVNNPNVLLQKIYILFKSNHDEAHFTGIGYGSGPFTNFLSADGSATTSPTLDSSQDLFGDHSSISESNQWPHGDAVLRIPTLNRPISITAVFRWFKKSEIILYGVGALFEILDQPQ